MSHAPSPDRFETMAYSRCGRSGLLLPRISLGLWHNFGDVDDQTIAREMILGAFDRGITHFDLANNYGPPPGSAERNFGRILRDDLLAHRDEMVISTKAGYRMWPGPCGEWGSRKSLLASLDQSLARIGIDRACRLTGSESPRLPQAGRRRESPGYSQCRGGHRGGTLGRLACWQAAASAL